MSDGFSMTRIRLHPARDDQIALVGLSRMVNLNVASWNRIAVWLQRIEALRGAA